MRPNKKECEPKSTVTDRLFHLPTLHTLQNQRHLMITLSVGSWTGREQPTLSDVLEPVQILP